MHKQMHYCNAYANVLLQCRSKCITAMHKQMHYGNALANALQQCTSKCISATHMQMHCGNAQANALLQCIAAMHKQMHYCNAYMQMHCGNEIGNAQANALLQYIVPQFPYTGRKQWIYRSCSELVVVVLDKIHSCMSLPLRFLIQVRKLLLAFNHIYRRKCITQYNNTHSTNPAIHFNQSTHPF